MIIDLNTVDADPFKGKKFDVCICGAGVAGITLALKLSKRLKVLLLEAGSYDYTWDSQAVYQGESIGREYFSLATTRLRYFGGTSNHWEGICRPLDSYDFERKSYLEYSGWPIDRSDLDPYVEETKFILDIPLNREEKGKVSLEDVPSMISKSQDFKSIEFWRSAPTRFGEKYRADLDRMPNIECYLNANVVGITLNENLSSVDYLEIRNYSGRVFNSTARINIIAAGGIENPRLLLNCNNQISDGLGNEAGLVGRFFAEHPHHTVGHFILQDQVKKKLAKNWVSQEKAKRIFAPTPEFMQQEEILNFGLRFMPYKPTNDPSFKTRLKNIICDSELAQGAVETIKGEKLWCFDGGLWMASEQAPNPSSRISLGSEQDKFGNQRIILDWRLSEIDKRTIRRAIIRFGAFFAYSGLGRVHLTDWLLSEDDDFELPGFGVDTIAAHHHMCTTRMGHTPRDGVVNSNQRLFDIENLYLAGSSVFSTGGHANPTFTIVQMSLRLADHINEVFKNRT